MDYKILDREFRDYSAELKYPFSDRAVLGSTAGLAVPAGAFIDALLYVPGSVELPIYLSSMRQTDDLDIAIVEFRDTFGSFVADCLVDLSSDYGIIYRYGIEAGSLVYDPTIIRQLVHATHGDSLSFGSNLPIQTGRCFMYAPPYISGVKDSSVGNLAGTVHKEDIFIVAANGVHFEVDGGDTVLIHLLGEEPPVDKPVLSINGVAREHMWIASRPDSGVKVETINNGIRFRSILDG